MSSRNNFPLPLAIAALVILIAAFVRVVLFTPIEQTMGIVQKVFYFHMSAAWVGMLGFLCAAIFGILYLTRRQDRWDHYSYAAIEVGLMFTVITILSGMLWARPIWNTWWTWDPRLTTVTIMGFTYLAYLLLRRGFDDPSRRARVSAVYAIIGFISVPLTFFSIRFLRTIHPVLIGAGADMSMDSRMLTTLVLSVITFTVLFAFFLVWRARLSMAQSTLEDSQRLELEDE